MVRRSQGEAKYFILELDLLKILKECTSTKLEHCLETSLFSTAATLKRLGHSS